MGEMFGESFPMPEPQPLPKYKKREFAFLPEEIKELEKQGLTKEQIKQRQAQINIRLKSEQKPPRVYDISEYEKMTEEERRKILEETGTEEVKPDKEKKAA